MIASRSVIHPPGSKPVELLLVEDNPGDARLTMEGLRESPFVKAIHHVQDGLSALAFLRRQDGFQDAVRPDAVLLDLNLPGMHGREVLAEIKRDENLRQIPVVILTSSSAEQDVLQSYDLHANCYVTKPVNVDRFFEVIRSIEHFWCAVVTLPGSDASAAPQDPSRGG